MRTLPAQFAAALEKPDPSLIPLVVITLTQPRPLTIRLSTREIEFAGAYYHALLSEAPSSRQGNVDPLTFQFTTSEATLVIDNTKPIYGADRFSDLIWHPTSNPLGHIFEFAECQIFVIAEDPPGTIPEAGNEVLQFAGRLEAPQRITPEAVHITVSDVILALQRRMDLLMVGPSMLPVMHEDDIGKMANVIYGSAREVPTIRATPGAVGILLDDTFLGGRMRILGCSRFNPKGGEIVIGNEILRYSGVICKEDQGGTVPGVLALGRQDWILRSTLSESQVWAHVTNPVENALGGVYAHQTCEDAPDCFDGEERFIELVLVRSGEIPGTTLRVTMADYQEEGACTAENIFPCHDPVAVYRGNLVGRPIDQPLSVAEAMALVGTTAEELAAQTYEEGVSPHLGHLPGVYDRFVGEAPILWVRVRASFPYIADEASGRVIHWVSAAIPRLELIGDEHE